MAFHLSFTVTLRLGEVLGLTWDCVDNIMVWNEDEIVLFAVNRDEENRLEANLQINEFVVKEVLESITMTADDKKTTNQKDHNAVVPYENKNVCLNERSKLWMQIIL